MKLSPDVVLLAMDSSALLSSPLEGGDSANSSDRQENYRFLPDRRPDFYRGRHYTEVRTDARLWEKRFLISLTSVKF
ncbi:hypothetical protein Q4S45_13045 [Massilia sp. R2A-15]|uniref:hypothetical protein n=1 Tax=Massilia sp. R2A-15 TaxID=3064278 RepID=UPI002733DACE|nr:hypothetical protein [Massilia sp. R2A-15]WLI87667.1 hypothetical protein Q4S45_13045 [Massilia sp. R2A-15]